ncbi:hypothetical protein [Nocardia sputi]|nr:hypothetical protein [Nocardia sputi]MBF6207028.1 hypothetical protein [Streptomyces gardneri]
MREGDRNTAREVSPDVPDKRVLDGRRVCSSARDGADELGRGLAQAR